MRDDEAFDVVVVGGGSAGGVVANRLSAEPDLRVLLLEAGGWGRHPMIAVPAGLAFLIQTGAVDWGYATTPQRGLDGRVVRYAQGRTVGGTSTINGMIYTRGTPGDYDRWADAGVKGWSFGDVLPYFRRSESFPVGDPAYRGYHGELRVTRPAPHNPLDLAWLEAGAQAGHPVGVDLNTGRDGFAVADRTVDRGVRQDTGRVFVRPAAHRPNLVVRTRAQVLGLVAERDRIVSVDYLHGKRRHRVRVRHEVIVSAGTYNTPKLLLLSGIGDPSRLADHGIPVTAALPGVGRNLQDHVAVAVKMRCRQPVSLRAQMRPGGAMRALGRYVTSRSGPMSAGGIETIANLRSGPEVDEADVQFHFTPMVYGEQGHELHGEHGFQAMGNVARPHSRGTVTLRSADPLAPPLIDPDYFADPRDLELTRATIRMTREVFAQRAFDAYRGDEIGPGPDVVADAGLDEYIRATADPVYHPVGTCAMGSGPDAVLDERLRVHGLVNLRVADASVMPFLPAANTNAPAIMIGERCADFVLRDALG